MTQAYNISQLANNLDSTGRLDAADGLVNAVPIANGGTGATTASAARTNLGVASSAFAIPSGGIIMWSGSVGTVPAGWYLCDGLNGTPDLRNRFVVGAGGSYGVGDSGGSANAIVVAHTHTTTVSDPGHSHTWQFLPMDGTQVGSGSFASGSGGTYGTSTSTTNISVGVNSSGSSGTGANLPPYYALAYIMKS